MERKIIITEDDEKINVKTEGEFKTYELVGIYEILKASAIVDATKSRA